MNGNPIPMFDYRQGLAEIRDEIDQAIREVLDSGTLILGPRVRQFEENFAHFLGVPGQAVAVGNGTDAIAVALRALGIGPGDEVLTVANTAIPTVSAIRMAGAAPVLVDVDPQTCLMDPALVESRITSRTKALLPVHLFGNAAPLAPLLEIAGRYGLKVVEDCAQSCGTRYRERATGTFGDVGCFSFYPTENLGAYGDGGLSFTRDPALAEAIRQIRAYGCGQTYYAEREGVNSRLDELQAAILDVKLRHLPAWLEKRRRVAGWYDAYLSPLIAQAPPRARRGPFLPPLRDPWRRPVPADRGLESRSDRLRHPLPDSDPPDDRLPFPRPPARRPAPHRALGRPGALLALLPRHQRTGGSAGGGGG